MPLIKVFLPATPSSPYTPTLVNGLTITVASTSGFISGMRVYGGSNKTTITWEFLGQ